jgi:hypothetical protein
LAYARRYPERFIPFVGMQRPELVDYDIWHRPTSFARRLVRETDAKLRTGEFFGMGEFMLRFYPYTNKFGIVAPSDMDYPADSYLMRTFADLSARNKVPMVVHAEAEPPVTDAMIRLLEAHPDAILVWAHNCGRSSAERRGNRRRSGPAPVPSRRRHRCVDMCPRPRPQTCPSHRGVGNP